MANIDNAIGVLQRSAVGRERVVNALPAEEFVEWAAGC